MGPNSTKIAPIIKSSKIDSFYSPSKFSRLNLTQLNQKH